MGLRDFASSSIITTHPVCYHNMQIYDQFALRNGQIILKITTIQEVFL